MNTSTASCTASTSPVRIYILWHPGFDRADLKGRDSAGISAKEKKAIGRGRALARRIYAWFRAENMEGIPVYFRSSEMPPEICDDGVLVNYIIPLVEAHMVASPVWRAYVAGFCKESGCRNRLLPVAVEPVAYNMPAVMRKLNYIRHDLEREPDESLISRLTEVMCRDLRGVVCARQAAGPGARPAPPDKLKIFLSHAKADDTKEATALKRYLQEETQCEAFFDETDIASGYDYAQVLDNAIQDESAGLIVIQGDHYADRPWCRREIRDFLKPVGDPPGVDKRTSALFIPPVVVVQTMQGKRIARNIADLGHAPCVKWQEGAARFVVTTLLREILFGLFYRLLARSLVRHAPAEETVFINRTPDPVMVARILVACGNFPPKIVAHPGYGLSSLERNALQEDFPKLEFVPFSQIPPEGGIETTGKLAGRILCVAAGNAPDILEAGLGDEHNHELLLRLLRPLFREQVSLLYGGRMPEVVRPLEPWESEVNFTGIFLDLLLSERANGTPDSKALSRLYNLSPWPDETAINPHVIAQWTDICSFIPVTLTDAGLKSASKPPTPPDPAELAIATPAAARAMQNRHAAEMEKHQIQLAAAKARCLTAMRKMACGEMTCPLPDGPIPPKPVVTFAHLYTGGKILGASGIIPGLFEEMLCALEARKPVYVIGASRGATGLLADWLAASPTERPEELKIAYYLRTERQGKIHEELKGEPGKALDRLWELLRKAEGRLAELLNNGLSDEKNLELLKPGTGNARICELIWEGISRAVTDAPAVA